MGSRLIAVALAAAFSVTAVPADAHDNVRAKHGGVVQVASDLAFELVAKPDGAVLYVEDHGKPVATTGMSGKLTVLNGRDKSEADLKPAGDNRLEAIGVKLSSGAKVVAALTTPRNRAITVRFAVK